MSVPTIQIAFQGGGAKFVAMLPAASAFITANETGVIKITRVSGTSAGSICAALVATKSDLTTVRRYLIGNAAAHLKNLVPRDVLSLLELAERRGKYKKLFSGIMNVGTIRDSLERIILRGQPVLNQKELANFIRNYFLSTTIQTK